MMPTRTRAGERTPMRSALWRAIPLVLVLILALAGCNGPSRGTHTNPSSASGFNIVVTASPNVLRAGTTSAGTTAAGGSATGGCAIVQANVFNTNGQLVTGATVTITSTLGQFSSPSTGSAVNGPTTAQGLFTAVLCAQTITGTAIVTASVENAFATTNITIF